jgi:hypothetical protein
MVLWLQNCSIMILHIVFDHNTAKYRSCNAKKLQFTAHIFAHTLRMYISSFKPCSNIIFSLILNIFVTNLYILSTPICLHKTVNLLVSIYLQLGNHGFQIGKNICLVLGNKRYLLEQCWKVQIYIAKVCRKICTVNCNFFVQPNL